MVDENKIGRSFDQVRKAALRGDWMGEAIVLSLLFIFLCLIGFALYGAFHASRESYDRTMELLNRLLPAVTGLLGLGIGFYFASGRSSR